jgi:hypothetical protein
MIKEITVRNNEKNMEHSLLIEHHKLNVFMNLEIKLQHPDINTGNRCLYE